MNTIKIFGQLVDVVGTDQISMPSKKVYDLRNDMLEKYSELKKHTFQISINHEIVFENVDFKDTDEIALLPPFAGG